MADFPTAKTNAVDNVTDVLAKHINNLENKVGIDSSTDTSSLDYKVNALESALPSGAIVGTTDTQELSSKTLTSPILKGSIGGWISIPVTCVYASADDPTYTMYVAGNATTYLWAGMRFKCTQTTDRMFIITAVGTYDSGNNRTPITLYGGTDFDLANATISNPYYSPVKCPYGFPMSPAKWTVSLVDDNSRAQASPTQNAWYNLNSSSISVPIGVWNVQFSAITGAEKATGDYLNSYITLSTANNSASTSAYTSRLESALDTFIIGNVSKSFVLTLTSKTTYYVNTRTTTASVTNIYRENLQLFATCAYL